MKRMYALIAGIIFAMAFTGWSWALELSPQDVSGNPGDEIVVPIRISDVGGGLDVDAFSFTIQFDSDVLTFNEGVISETERSGTLTEIFTLAEGRIIETVKAKVNGAMFGAPLDISGEGLFINLKFTVNENADRDSSLRLSDFDDDIAGAVTSDAAFTLNDSDTDTLTVTSPTVDQEFRPGDTVTVSWIGGGDNIRVAGKVGSTFPVIDENGLSANGSTEFTIPEDAFGDSWIQVISGGDRQVVEFVVIEADSDPGGNTNRITLECPDPDDEHCLNLCDGAYRNKVKIRWKNETEGNIMTSVDFYYSLGHGSWEHIWTDLAPNNKYETYEWPIDKSFIHDDVRVRVVAEYNAGGSAEAVGKSIRVIDGTAPTVNVLKPAGGKVYEVGQPVDIEWQVSNSPSYEVEWVDVKVLPSGGQIRLYGANAESGNFTWYPESFDVTDIGQVQITVAATNCTESQAKSSGYFEIQNPHDPSSSWETAKRIFNPLNRDRPNPSWSSRGWKQNILYPDVLVDKNGEIHVVSVFQDSIQENTPVAMGVHCEYESQIYYVRGDGESWQSQEQATKYSTMKNDGYLTWPYGITRPELALDSSGYPHIVYEHAPAGSEDFDVHYVQKTGSGWALYKNLSNSPSNRSVSPKIAVDQDDNVYVFWYEIGEGVQYSVRQGNSWSSPMPSPIDRDPFDIVMDDQNVLRIAGRKSGQGYSYAQLKDGEWSSPELFSDSSFWVVQIYSAENQTYVAGSRNGELHLFTNISGTWETEINAWPERPSQSFPWIDAGGNLYVVYKNGNREMSERVNAGSGWSDSANISAQTVSERYSASGGGKILATVWDSYYSDHQDVFLSYSEMSDFPLEISFFEGKAVSEDDPLTVEFTVDAREGSSPIREYKYTFGDGEEYTDSVQTTVTHTYSEGKTYTAFVTVTDESGRSTVKYFTITVSAPKEEPVLSVTPLLREVSATNDSTTFEVANIGSGTMNWTVEVVDEASWLTIVSGSSEVDDGTIIVACEASTVAERVGTISISAGGESKTVKVKQASGLQPVLFVAPPSRSVPPDGSDELVFTVRNTGTGDMIWTAELVDAPSWLSIVSQNSAEGTLTVSCEESTGPERTSEIRITAPGATGSPKTVKIIQEALEPVLSLTPTMYPVSPDSGKVIFVIENTGNGTMNWTAEVEPDASSWLTIEGDSSGENDGMIYVKYESNLGEARIGEITITAPGATGSPGKLEIKQDAYGVTDGVVMDMDISTETIDPMVQASEDDEVWVGIVAQQVTNLHTFQVDVSFPPEGTAFVEGAEDNLGEGPNNFLKSQGGRTINLSAVETDDGTANVFNGLRGSNCDEAPDGSGHIGFLKFRVLSSDSDIKLEPNNVAFMPCEGIPKTVTDLTSGTISPFSRYDFNRDGAVDDVDLELLRDHRDLTEDDSEWDPKYNLKPIPNSSGKQVVDLWDVFEFTSKL